MLMVRGRNDLNDAAARLGISENRWLSPRDPLLLGFLVPSNSEVDYLACVYAGHTAVEDAARISIDMPIPVFAQTSPVGHEGHVVSRIDTAAVKHIYEILNEGFRSASINDCNDLLLRVNCRPNRSLPGNQPGIQACLFDALAFLHMTRLRHRRCVPQ